jgi:anionic cell wall polymer biosynthesis LytR-Cps2A-Psr (LCP) family protein
VERLTGIHLDHYLELDFASFMKIVDVLGGVQVCTPHPLRDPMSGLELPAGTSVLDGGRALEYVRARHIDGTADIGRMQRQQRFVAEIVHRATRSGLLLNPVKLAQAVRTTLGAVRADSSLGTGDLITLAAGMRNLSSHSAEFATVPLSDLNFAVPLVGSTVKWDEAQAAKLFDAVRDDRPITQPRRVAAVAGQTVAPAAHAEQRPRPRPSATGAPVPKGNPAISAAADAPPVTGDQVLCR